MGRNRAWQLAASRGFGEMLLLLVGALGYGLIEVFWRGYTHWSMLIAGAIGLCVIDYLDENSAGLGDWGKAWLSSLILLSMELIIGVAVNIYGGGRVWDYSTMPYNFLGQICLYYALIWLLLARIALPVRRWFARGLKNF